MSDGQNAALGDDDHRPLRFAYGIFDVITAGRMTLFLQQTKGMVTR
jgi:hypothetical protein